MQLAAWLETCVRQVITVPYDTITAETGKLLANIKKDQLGPSEVKNTTAFFEDPPADRADALGAGLFGPYTNTGRTPVVADNVLLLWPELWPETRSSRTARCASAATWAVVVVGPARASDTVFLYGVPQRM
ncbi:hypothetical protein OHB07_00550 [Streptomyces sp. NBC_00111]|uniref:hypothetical protein n=1 Tax=Streptomyces sp. NBC_00111 TaxID=2975655 RepID=UPI00324B4AE3